MEKTLFRKPDFDNRLGIIRPACLPKDWYELYQENRFFKKHGAIKEIILNHNDVPHDGQFIKSRFKFWDEDFLQDHVEYIEKYNGKKYFYFIPISTDNWFMEMENIGFSGIEEDIKKDIRNKNCKIILIATDEGFYGSYGDVYSPSNWDLDLIQKWCEIEKFPSDSLVFISMNMIGNIHNVKKSLSYSISGTSWLSERHLLLRKDYKLKKSNYNEFQQNSKLFLTYNNAIHIHRVGLLYFLNEYNLLENSLCSFNFIENDGLYNHCINSFKQMNRDVLSFDKFDEILKQLPIKIENDYNPNDFLNYDFKGQVSIREHYENSFLSLVSETLYKNGAVYFSEKTFKPIYECHPFLLLSSKGSLKKLKELGYQTFDRWWDESYDECDDYIERIKMICDVLVELKSKSFDELYKMKIEMRDVLIQNYENFIQRCTQNPNPIIEIIKHEYEKFVKNG